METSELTMMAAIEARLGRVGYPRAVLPREDRGFTALVESATESDLTFILELDGAGALKELTLARDSGSLERSNPVFFSLIASLVEIEPEHGPKATPAEIEMELGSSDFPLRLALLSDGSFMIYSDSNAEEILADYYAHIGESYEISGMALHLDGTKEHISLKIQRVEGGNFQLATELAAAEISFPEEDSWYILGVSSSGMFWWLQEGSYWDEEDED